MSATYSVHDNVIVAPSIATAAFGGGLTPSCSNMDIISNETLMQILVTLTDGEDIKAARLVNKYVHCTGLYVAIIFMFVKYSWDIM